MTVSTPPSSNQSVSAALRQINLDALSELTFAITPAGVGFYKESCMVCFYHNGHRSGVTLRVESPGSKSNVEVCWVGDVDKRMLGAYAEEKRATDFAACAIALALIRELTGYVGVEQSSLGTTIDYHLSNEPPDSNLIFNNTARLEVSGILTESATNTVESRIQGKVKRLKKDDDLPDYIIVIEFGQPWSKMALE